MRKKKFLIVVGTVLTLIFVVSGIETIREEVSDQKLKNEQLGRQITHETVFEPFLKNPSENEDTCFCSQKLATAIDHILYRGNKNFIRRPITKSIAKMMSLTALPACLLCDTAQYTAKGIYEGILLLSTENKGDKKRLKQHLSKVKRCLIGFATFPSGVVSADMVSQHFVTHYPTQNLVEPYGKLYSAKCLELNPKTYEDVSLILKEAKRLGKQVTFAGALMSQGKQALPNDEQDLLIHFEHLNSVEIDPNRRVARVGAGALWGDIQSIANEYGLAVKVMQASNVFSLGGSLSINCHGWDHKAGTLKETVDSLLIADSDGEIRRLYPTDELFELVIGGLGGFGAILEADISLTPNTQMTYDAVEMSTEDYLSYFQNEVIPNNDIGMHYFRLCFDPKKMFETGIALNYFEKSSKQVISKIPEEPQRGNIQERVELGVIRRIPKALPVAWKIERSESLKSKEISRNEAMTFHLRCIFNESTIDAEWLQEYFVPANQLNEFLSFLGGVLKDNNVPVYNASIRFVKQSKSQGFSYARNDDMFAIVLFFNQSLLPEEIQKTRFWVQSVIDYLEEHEGTYYLPYQNFATQEQFRKCYPEWKEILEKKKQYDPDLLFTNGFYEEYVLPQSQVLHNNDSLFRSTFSDPIQREWVKDFLCHVFMQLDEDKFISLVDDILSTPNVSDEDVYRALQNRLFEGSFSFFKKYKQTLKSLNTLKNELSDQMQELMGESPINGYVEIGYPGRLCRPLKKKLNLNGPIYVINEKEQLADYIESGFPRPYNRFVYLNEYDVIRHQDIPSESVDLVAMYIGLHHIPENRLVPFIQSIQRILSPGGSFVLMDHDATSERHKEMLSVIHSIFNVGTGVTIEEELREFRNFQSFSSWESLLEKQGFVRDSHLPLIRHGDATLNSLVRFTKKVTTEEEFCTHIHSDPEYIREPIRTYLTAPEWHNVRLTQGYCRFIEDTPFYQFPWFTEIKNMWSVFGESWKVARRHASFKEVLLSDCTLMNLFITIFNSIEYTIKGAISLPLSLIYTNESIEDTRHMHLLVKTDIDLSAIDSRIQVEDEYSSSNLKHITMPRYMEMFHILLKLSREDLTYIDIAGQKKIQVDLNVEKNQELILPTGCEKLYEIPATADPTRVYLSLDVEVEHLNTALRWFIDNNTPIVYIHDF